MSPSEEFELHRLRKENARLREELRVARQSSESGAAHDTPEQAHRELEHANRQLVEDSQHGHQLAHEAPAGTPSECPLATDQLRSLRILVAEDNTANQLVAQAILKKLGLHGNSVANGQEAIDALSVADYDLVLMDVQMPVLSGLAATETIRNPRSPVRNHAIPVIAMTAHAMKGDREWCLAHGMDDYITKPVTEASLLEVLRRVEQRLTPPLAPQAGPAASAPTTADGELPVFDHAALSNRLDGAEDLLELVVEDFLHEVPGYIDQLAAAVHDVDLEAVKAHAHKVKGVAATVCAEVLRELAETTEHLARADDLDALHQAAERLRSAMSDLQREIPAQLAAQAAVRTRR